MQRKISWAPKKRYESEDSAESAAITDDPVALESDTSSCLNYSTEEFNRIDDLDDNVGNYRSFEPLTGIVTSDMRYHEKRKRQKAEEALIKTRPPEASEEQTAENIILKSGPEDENARQPLTIVSHGRVLVIDSDLERGGTIAEFLGSRGMRCLFCVVDAAGVGISPSHIDSVPLVEVTHLSVSGGFGGFMATVAGMDTAATDLSSFTGRLSGLPGHDGGHFDLVLDMQKIPSYAGEQLPLGYYAPAENMNLLESALQELPELKGRFHRPQFVDLLKDSCLYDRHRLLECRRCLEICPVGAIERGEEGLAVNHFICQGCGGCALVCPADAIELLNPSMEELLDDLCRKLREQREEETSPSKDVVLYDRDPREPAVSLEAVGNEEGSIFIEVEEMGRIGVAVMLMLLAAGAAGITLVCSRRLPDKLRQALERQVQLGRSILSGLQLAPDLIRLVDPVSCSPDPEETDDSPAVSFRLAESISPLPFKSGSDLTGRGLLRLAAGHLAQARNMGGTIVELPAWAPFGTVEITEECSLCMACVSTCPPQALAAGGDAPRLFFVEADCHQCGLCAAVCPEDAVRLRSRLLCTTAVDESRTLLKEGEAARCVECDKPFASKAIVGRLQEKLSGHWMYRSSRQLRRLKMCAACRTRDALLDKGYHDETR